MHKTKTRRIKTMSESSLLKEFRVTLETVTPLFLGGAEARGAPELRPPSIRGAMRYWLRALLGGKLGDSREALSELKRIEGSVFGTAGEGKYNGASAIGIRIVNPDLKDLKTFQKEGTRNKPKGGDYLYWSMNESERGKNDNRKFMPPGSSFDLILSARPGIQDPEMMLICAIGSLWLLTHLGGIGARSRHLAGNLSVKSSNIKELNFGVEGMTITEAAKQLSTEITKLRNKFALENKGTSAQLSEFDILHPKHSSIWVLKTYKTSAEAIDEVGKYYYSFRSDKHGNDAPHWLLKRSVFGLPIQGIKGSERRSSPLWLSLIPITNGYAVVATLFKSRLLKDGQKLDIRTKSGEVLKSQSPPSDYTLIGDWVKENFINAEEVKYD
jgi:CRISPR-associated protein Cmr1